MPGPTIVPKRPAAVVPAGSEATLKLGKPKQPVNSDSHGELCECVDCYQTNFKKHRSISVPETHCKKVVKIHVDIECKSVKKITDHWSYELDGQKCEEIDPEPNPCDHEDDRN